MAHVGRRYPLHWRRDMSLNAGHHSNGLPMYYDMVLWGFELPGITISGELNYTCMSFPDFQGTRLYYESDAFGKYGKFFQAQHYIEPSPDQSQTRHGVRLEMSGAGLVFEGYFSVTPCVLSQNNYGALTISACTQPAVFRPYQVHINWQQRGVTWPGWHSAYPGVAPWPPS